MWLVVCDMKKINLLIMSLLFYATGVLSQTYYYNATKTFNMGSYTYQCDTDDSYMVTLYNKTNQFTYAPQKYKDGTYPKPGVVLKDVEDDTSMQPLVKSIVNNAFTPAQKQKVKGELLSIAMRINPETGKVIEVEFGFLKNDPFATVDVAIYRSIEMGLKNQISFKPTAEGKKLNYMIRAWMHKVQ
ncbi:hypothetical protein AGMMS50262_17140 [Bacteroidia bacterium]|nr:hypothetical protein AGMMS50262_17140 [Bacteroidia bacterium]